MYKHLRQMSVDLQNVKDYHIKLRLNSLKRDPDKRIIPNDPYALVDILRGKFVRFRDSYTYSKIKHK